MITEGLREFFDWVAFDLRRVFWLSAAGLLLVGWLDLPSVASALLGAAFAAPVAMRIAARVIVETLDGP